MLTRTGVVTPCYRAVAFAAQFVIYRNGGFNPWFI